MSPFPSNLYSIAPHAAFLPTLASALKDGRLLPDWPRQGAFWLSDVTIFVPTQRARLSLVTALSDQFGATMLLPDIRTLGGDAGEEDLFLPPYDGASLPQSQSRLRRQLLLSSAIEAWSHKVHDGENVLGAAEILRRAEALGDLIDDFNVAQVPLQNLAQLEVDDKAGHWAESKQFLDFAFSHWPDILAADNQVDASQLRNLKLDRFTSSLAQKFGDKPVIVAGSTGSIPSTADLLKGITSLPNGALVLPGLDTELSQDQQTALGQDNTNPHAHPQYGLMKLLNRLGMSPQSVTELADSAGEIRTHIVRRAFDLPEDTANWQSQSTALLCSPDAEAALAPLSLLCAKTESEQAQAIALACVSALRENKSVGVISPDRNLARRIAAHLHRYGIDVDDAAGAPLFQSRAGRLARQILAVTLSDYDASDLMALLQNANVTLGRTRKEIAALGRNLDLAGLRGQIPISGLDELKTRISENPTNQKRPHAAPRLQADQVAQLLSLIDDLAEVLEPLRQRLTSSFGPSQLVADLADALDKLCTTAETEKPAQFPGLSEWRVFALDMQRQNFGAPQLNALNAIAALEGLMGGIVVRTPMSGRPDIDIFGQLEARLQHRDLMILCGLNEEIWPEAADPGPWMGRQMRMDVGLEPPERAHGLAAHDFMMAMGNASVLLSYSEQVGASPAEPSRFVQRLTSFVGESRTRAMLAKGQALREQVARLDVPSGSAKPAERPMPQPLATDRTRKLSFTEAEHLIYSPYHIYARKSLALNPLDDLSIDISHRERGNILHAIFDRFVAENLDVMAASAEHSLRDLAIAQFAAIDGDPDRRDIWLRRFDVSAQRFLEFERARNERVAKRHSEQYLSLSFPTAAGEFTLHGRADRIDLMKDGTFEVMDFKTGSIPTKEQMQNLLAPQMPLEAYVIATAGFSGQSPAPVSALKYIKIANGPEAFVESDFVCPDGMDVMQVAEQSFMRLQRHIAHFLERDDVPMPPNLVPKKNQRFAGPYDHLARLKEWEDIQIGGDE